MDAAFPMKSGPTSAVTEPAQPQPGNGSFERPVDIGLRRVSWVRITIAPGSVRYEAVGIGHRRMVIRRIPGPTAVALLANGTRLVVRRAAR